MKQSSYFTSFFPISVLPTKMLSLLLFLFLFSCSSSIRNKSHTTPDSQVDSTTYYYHKALNYAINNYKSNNISVSFDNWPIAYDNKKIERENNATEFIAFLILSFLLFACAYILIIWIKQNQNHKRYMTLQQKLMQVRVDVMSLGERKEQKCHEEKTLDKLVLLEKTKEQFQLCIAVFQNMDEYEKFLFMNKATMIQLKTLNKEISLNIKLSIHRSFADVMLSLKSYCPTLTNDDAFYCVLSLLHCSGMVIMELMNVTPGVLKSRKNRIKNKIEPFLFEYIFNTDNQPYAHSITDSNLL